MLDTSFKVLLKNDYDNYLEHVKSNMRNCRTTDNDLLKKIKDGLDQDPRILIFAEIDSNNKIIRSVMTKKKRNVYEYIIVNIRSSTNFFNKNKFLNLFDFIFNYYEKEKYYRWILARPIDLLNSSFFKDFYLKHPFSKYETAIEAHSSMQNFDNTIYNLDLLSSIPENLNKDRFIIISGFCKQIHRKFDSTLSDAYV